MKKLLLIVMFVQFLSGVSFATTMVEAHIVNLENVNQSVVRVFYQVQESIATEAPCHISHSHSSELKNMHFDLNVDRNDFDMWFELILFAMANNYKIVVMGQGECNGSIEYMDTLAFR